MNGYGKDAEYSCGAVLFSEEDGLRRYVVIQEMAGHCGLVKGHMEEGESERETALREIEEEVGLRGVEFIGGFEERVSFPLARGAMKHVTFFLASCDGQELRPRQGEIRSVRLLPYAEAREAIALPAIRSALDRAEVFLNRRG